MRPLLRALLGTLALAPAAHAQFPSFVDTTPTPPPTATWPVFSDIAGSLGSSGADLADDGTGRGQVWADLVGVGPGGELTGPDGITDWYQANSNSPALPTDVPPGEAEVPPNGSSPRPCRLFRGLPDGTYDEVALQASPDHPAGFGLDLPGGSPWGVSTGDYDGDGFLDVFVPCGGFIMDSPNALLRANGDGTFTNVATAAGLPEIQASRTGIWLDADRDGDLDLHVTNGHPQETVFFLGNLTSSSRDRFYQNQGDGTFLEKGDLAGIAFNGTSFAATTADLDQDGFTDLAISCFKQFNKVFYSQGNGTFRFMLPAGSPVSIPLSNLSPDPQFPGAEYFAGPAALANLQDQLPILGEISMPVEAADFNGDGWIDLIFACWSNQQADANLMGAEGAIFGPYERAYLYLNKGDQDGDGFGDGLFREVAEEVQVNCVGGVMGLRVGDYNGDSFPDVYMAAGGPKVGVHLEEDYTFINEPMAWPDDFLRNPDQPLERAFYELGAWVGTYTNTFMAHGVNNRVGQLGTLDLIISNGGPGQFNQGQTNKYFENTGNADGSTPVLFEVELEDPGAPLPHGMGARIDVLRDHGGGAGQVLTRQRNTKHSVSYQNHDPVPFFSGDDDLLFTSVRWPDGWTQGLLMWPFATQVAAIDVARAPLSMRFERTDLPSGAECLSADIQVAQGQAVGSLWLAHLQGVTPGMPAQSPFAIVSLDAVELPLIVDAGSGYSASVDLPEVAPGWYVLRYVGLAGETLAEAALWRDPDSPALAFASAVDGVAAGGDTADERFRRSVLARERVRVRAESARLVPNVPEPSPAETFELDLSVPGIQHFGQGAQLSWDAGELTVELGTRPAQWQFQGQQARLYLDVPMACCSESVIDPATGESLVPADEGWRLELAFPGSADAAAADPWLLEIDDTTYARSGARSLVPTRP